MAVNPSILTRVSDTELAMQHAFEAPPERVWQAWTDPEQIKRWWAPQPWTVSYCTVDLRPGGEWVYCMRGPDGTEGWGKAVYQQIDAPSKLVYEDSFVDADGNLLPGMPVLNMTITFEPAGSGTLLQTRVQCATAAEVDTLLSMGMSEGYAMGIQQLEALLAA